MLKTHNMGSVLQQSIFVSWTSQKIWTDSGEILWKDCAWSKKKVFWIVTEDSFTTVTELSSCTKSFVTGTWKHHSHQILWIFSQNYFKNSHTAEADEDVMKDGASVGVELFQVFVLARCRLGFHCLKVNVMIDEALETDILTSEPRQFPQLTQTHIIINQSINQSKHICIVPYVANEPEARQWGM